MTEFARGGFAVPVQPPAGVWLCYRGSTVVVIHATEIEALRDMNKNRYTRVEQAEFGKPLPAATDFSSGARKDA